MKLVCSNILFVDKFVNSAFLIKKRLLAKRLIRCQCKKKNKISVIRKHIN